MKRSVELQKTKRNWRRIVAASSMRMTKMPLRQLLLLPQILLIRARLSVWHCGAIRPTCMHILPCMTRLLQCKGRLAEILKATRMQTKISDEKENDDNDTTSQLPSPYQSSSSDAAATIDATLSERPDNQEQFHQRSVENNDLATALLPLRMICSFSTGPHFK